MATTVRLLVSIIVPLSVGGLSGIATVRGVRDWYPGLIKPIFNPPDWIFGPVWTLLYVMMGLAAFMVWQRGLKEQAVRLALSVFLIQLLFNGLWSFLFFGMKSPALAFVEILVLWLLIAATVYLFWRVRAAAGVILLPYAAWVSFAALLNGSIWMLNR